MTEELLLCQCSDPAHQLIMFYDDDIEAPAVYVSVHLSPEPNFFKRLWNGLKYIFGSKRSIYGDFDEIILRPTDVDKLRKAVNVLESINHKTNVPLFVEQEKLS